MAQTAEQTQAKRLMKSLRLPAQLNKVVHDRRYWFEEFLVLFLEKCDALIFDEPRKGLILAKAAPFLAQRLEDVTPARRTLLKARAFTVQGSAYRAVQNLSAANAAHRQALAFSGLTTLERTHILRRLANLRIAEKRFDDALRLIEDVLEAFEAHGEEEHYAKALNSRGALHFQCNDFETAIIDFSEALRHIHPKTSPRDYHSLVHNLAMSLSHSAASIETLDAALENVRAAARYGKVGLRSAPRFKLRYVQGIVLVRLGMTKRAEAEFNTARRGFIELGLPYSTALVSLELGALYHQEGRWNELQALAAKTFALFDKAQCADSEALAAMNLWVEATREKTITTVKTARIRDVLNHRSRWTSMQR